MSIRRVRAALSIRAVSWALALGVLLAAAHAAAHPHAPGVVQDGQAVVAGASFEADASLDEGCALCGSRGNECDFAAFASPFPAPKASALALPSTSLTQKAPVRFGESGLARAPPSIA